MDATYVWSEGQSVSVFENMEAGIVYANHRSKGTHTSTVQRPQMTACEAEYGRVTH